MASLGLQCNPFRCKGLLWITSRGGATRPGTFVTEFLIPSSNPQREPARSRHGLAVHISKREWPLCLNRNDHQRKYAVVNIIHRLQNASTIYPEITLGKFRGIWRDQIFADDDITGDEFKVMYAIESF